MRKKNWLKDLKPVPKEEQERIRKLARDGKFEPAPRDRLREYRKYTNKLLDALAELGYAEVFITDESSTGDFPFEASELAAKLGIPCEENDYFGDIVQRLAEKDNPQ